jgi:hypothetical protein
LNGGKKPFHFFFKADENENTKHSRGETRYCCSNAMCSDRERVNVCDGGSIRGRGGGEDFATGTTGFVSDNTRYERRRLMLICMYVTTTTAQTTQFQKESYLLPTK